MKKLLIISFMMSMLTVGCKQSTGHLMETANTIQVKETDTPDSIILKAAHVIPTKQQLAAMEDEYIAFVHFGPNTFTRKEWGNGEEDPGVFNLQNLDTDQWCEAIKAGGMTKVIFTAKHHDGFVLWQSRYTKHGIMSSPFKNGKGDVLKQLSASCRKYGLKLGVYLSPADLYQIENSDGLYGNLSQYTTRTIPRAVEGRPFENQTTFSFLVDDYNEYFLNQLFELLTEYGPIHEVWFDGAHPKRKGGQKYNYHAWRQLIRKLAPEAVVFGKEDIRWCGNEEGATRDTEWNVIPYQENPDEMNMFPDITGVDIASDSKIIKGKYLHYQPAETNTSIREGWFYRDDETQMVRSADDVFDMYERAVGGNSIFLLNMPPDRNGLLPQKDVDVIREVGSRINQTYGSDIFEHITGPRQVLDNDLSTYQLLDGEKNYLELASDEPLTINRFVVQEAVATHGERVKEHAVEALINGQWKEIARGANIGYKRILRFPAVTSQRFRFKVLDSRYHPAIANISAYYCELNPPQLQLRRDINGKVTIEPKKHLFRWKSHGLDPIANLNKDLEIYYTTDGSEPDRQSVLYTGPVFINPGDVLKARGFSKNKEGAILAQKIGLVKKDWKLVMSDSQQVEKEGEKAFDENVNTFWMSQKSKHGHVLTIDLQKIYPINGFIYTPQKKSREGMIQRGLFEVSKDNRNWIMMGEFEFGNLINMPTPRTHDFEKSEEGRYIRIRSIEIAGESNLAAIAEIDIF